MLLIPAGPCVCCHRAAPLLHPLNDHMAEQGDGSWNHCGSDRPSMLNPTIPWTPFFRHIVHPLSSCPSCLRLLLQGYLIGKRDTRENMANLLPVLTSFSTFARTSCHVSVILGASTLSSA